MTFAGIFLAGVSVAIFKASDFGTDPNSCFVMGVWNLAGIKYSYVYIAINALMLKWLAHFNLVVLFAFVLATSFSAFCNFIGMKYFVFKSGTHEIRT